MPSWDAISAVAELLGSLAVFITLAYLALQVRHGRELLEENRRVARSAVYQERAKIRIDLVTLGATSDHIAPLISKVDGNPERIDELSTEERARLRLWYTAVMVMQDNVLYQHENDLVDISDMQTPAAIKMTTPIAEKLGVRMTPRIQKWLQSQKPRDQNEDAGK